MRQNKSSASVFKFLKLGLTMLLLSYSMIAFSGCKLCTVVKMEKDEAQGQEIKVYFENENFDADKYVNDIWESKVIPYIIKNAHKADVVTGEFRKNRDIAGDKYGIRASSQGGCPWNFIIRGKGRILSVNTTSLAGTIDIDLGQQHIKIQIGPVIKGTSIRDALDFIHFDDFTDQIEFAKLSNAINKVVNEQILAKIDFKSRVNKEIEFIGAFTDNSSDEILVVPVAIVIP